MTKKQIEQQLNKNKEKRKNCFKNSVRNVMERLLKERQQRKALAIEKIFDPPMAKIEEEPLREEPMIKIEDEDGLPAVELELKRITDELDEWIEGFQKHISDGVELVKQDISSEVDNPKKAFTRKANEIIKPTRIRRKMNSTMRRLRVNKRAQGHVFKTDMPVMVEGGLVLTDYVIRTDRKKYLPTQGRQMDELAKIIGGKEVMKRFKVRQFLLKTTTGFLFVYKIPYFRVNGQLMYPTIKGIQLLDEIMMERVVRLFQGWATYETDIPFFASDWKQLESIIFEKVCKVTSQKTQSASEMLSRYAEQDNYLGLWDEILTANLFQDGQTKPWAAQKAAILENRGYYDDEDMQKRRERMVKHWVSAFRYSDSQGRLNLIWLVFAKNQSTAFQNIVKYLSSTEPQQHMLYKSMFNFHWSILETKCQKISYLTYFPQIRQNLIIDEIPMQYSLWPAYVYRHRWNRL